MEPRLRAMLRRTRPVRFPVGVCAHRGNSEEYPENTLAAFHSAIECGVDMIEIDVRSTADGHPVIMHDRSLERTTGVDRAVAKVSLAELRKLDAGRWKGRAHAGERIPELHHVLALADNQVALAVHLKPRSQRLARAVARALMEFGLERRSIVLSFHWGLLRTIKEISPNTLTMAAFSVRAAQLRLALRHPHSDAIGSRTSGITARVRRASLARRKFVAAWPVNKEKDLVRLVSTKAADLIVTDRPRAVVPLLEQLRKS